MQSTGVGLHIASLQAWEWVASGCSQATEAMPIIVGRIVELQCGTPCAAGELCAGNDMRGPGMSTGLLINQYKLQHMTLYST